MILEDVAMAASLEDVIKTLIDNDVEFLVNIGEVMTVTLKLEGKSAVKGCDRVLACTSEETIALIKEVIIEAIAALDKRGIKK